MKSKNLYVKSAKVQKCKTCGNKMFDSQKMCTVVTKLQK